MDDQRRARNILIFLVIALIALVLFGAVRYEPLLADGGLANAIPVMTGGNTCCKGGFTENGDPIDVTITSLELWIYALAFVGVIVGLIIFGIRYQQLRRPL